MRRFLTILAVTVIMAAPSLSIAKNPFDFSDWVRKSHSETEADEDTGSSVQEEATATPSDSRSYVPRKNYRDELFGGGDANRSDTTSHQHSSRPWYPPQYRERLADPKPMPKGRPRLKEMPTPAAKITQDDLHSPQPEDTLQRFDEFLKSRRVDNAGYEEKPDAPPDSEIQPVSDTSEADNFWGPEPGSPQGNGSDERHDLPTIQAAPPTRREPASDRFSFVEDEPQEQPKAGNRLTETIPTAPGNRGRRHSQDEPTFHEVNPFAIERTSAKSAPNTQNIPNNPPTAAAETDSDQQQNKSRFSITRAARSELSTAPSAVVAPASQPDTDQRNADILTVWSLTGPLNVGQESPCELRITNQRKTPAEDVRVDAILPETLRIAHADPAPVAVDGAMRWHLDLLAPGEERTIHVVLLPSQPGPARIAAHVHLSESKLQSLTVTEPQLLVEISGPKDVTVGEPATQTVTVRNPGSGVATNVKLEAHVPEGLEHVRGKRLLMNIGSLNPGEARRVRLALAAIAGGQQVLQVEARADAGLVQTAAAEVAVVAPKLEAGITGPGLRYLGREATYTVRVANVGEAETDAVQVLHHIPEGFDFVRSDRGARFNETSRNLTWFVGRLGSDQPQELKVTLVAKKVGEFEQAVRATSAHGSISDAKFATRVKGTPSLVLEVDDLDDPVEVGRETAYEVTIANEGTASSHDVNLACELPAGLNFLKAAGPVDHHAGTGGIVFDPIAEVKAGESLTFRVYVKGTVQGDKRFRCRLSSINLSQPLFTEESTKFYGE